jgi:poly(A) polymerase
MSDLAPAAGAGEPAAVAAFAALRRDPVVLALLAACGATECHLVGGALRDRALGLATHDLDAMVAGRGSEIAAELAASLPARLVLLGGKDFAAYRLVLGASPSDGDHRAGGASRNGGADGAASSAEEVAAHPAKTAIAILDLWDRQSTPLHGDLARRDFTVNSFALEPRGGEVVDPFGGLADLERGTLRATTERSFDGDPLRVLRLVRLLVQLPGFSVERETFELARRAAPRLAEMAAERIREELRLVFSQPRSARSGSTAADTGLRALADLDLYPGLWLGTPGAPGGREAAAAAARATAEVTALPGCAAELERLLGAGSAPQIADGDSYSGSLAPAAAGSQPAIDLTAARFAATCRQLPTAAGAPGQEAKAALDRMQEAGYVSARQAAEIAPLLAEPPLLPETALDCRRFVHRHGCRWLTVACAYGGAAAAAGDAARERWRHGARLLCELARREGPELIAPPRLLDGDDVQRLLGIAAGPDVGAALAALTAAQVAGSVRTRHDAESFLRDWIP